MVMFLDLRGASGRPPFGPSSTPASRHLYIKLPLEQPRFHWRFESAAEFLSGSLTIRIIRDASQVDAVIFDDGVISEGWRPIGEDRGGTIYFGFVSSKPYLTAPGDSLEIELHVPRDLAGQGQLATGILRAGLYSSTGSYSTIADRSRALPEELLPLAIMQCWREKWPLVITGDQGWLGPEAAAQARAPRRELGPVASWFAGAPPRGTVSDYC